MITNNQQNGNCQLPKDNSFIRSKDKNLFISHNNSSNNIPTFNRFTIFYNDEQTNNNVSEQNNQNDVIVTTQNSTIRADVRNILPE